MASLMFVVIEYFTVFLCICICTCMLGKTDSMTCAKEVILPYWRDEKPNL